MRIARPDDLAVQPHCTLDPVRDVEAVVQHFENTLHLMKLLMQGMEEHESSVTRGEDKFQEVSSGAKSEASTSDACSSDSANWRTVAGTSSVEGGGSHSSEVNSNHSQSHSSEVSSDHSQSTPARHGHGTKRHPHKNSAPSGMTTTTVTLVPLQVPRSVFQVPSGKTTLAVRNIPARCNVAWLVKIWPPSFSYNLIYLPFSRSVGKNRGHAFINFVSWQKATNFVQRWQGRRVVEKSRTKPLDMITAHAQGFEETLRLFKAHNPLPISWDLIKAFNDEGEPLDMEAELSQA